MLPEHDVVIVDEAHELVDRVTGVATAELTTGAVDRARHGAAAKLVDEAVADASLERGRGPRALVLEDLPPGRWEALPEAAADVLSAVRDAAVPCKRRCGRRAARGSRAGTGRRSRRPPWTRSRTPRPPAQRVRRAGRRARGADVVWLAEQGPDGARSRVLRAAPLAVGGLLRERLFAERRP